MGNNKRKSESNQSGSGGKRSKPWMAPRNGPSGHGAPSIEPGDAGIWATCDMGKEGKCTSELRDLFEDYAVKLYGETNEGTEEVTEHDDDTEIDIEAEINEEVRGIKAKSTKKGVLFQPVKIDVQCVLFFKTQSPIEPVSFVHQICKDALEGAAKRHRWVKRLTPMTMMGKATPETLEKVALSVLGPVFHMEDVEPKKFAIRPTRRNHNVMKRDEIIKQVAKAVGWKHSVDLKNYDHLILVDVYRNLLGMSVVGKDFEELKQFNLAEIYDPTPKPNAEEGIAEPKPTANDKNFDASPTTVAVNSEAAPTPGEKTRGHAAHGNADAQAKSKDLDNSIPNPSLGPK